MSSLLRQLTDKYWFRVLLSLSLGITTTLLATNGTFVWMAYAFVPCYGVFGGSYDFIVIIPVRYFS